MTHPNYNHTKINTVRAIVMYKANSCLTEDTEYVFQLGQSHIMAYDGHFTDQSSEGQAPTQQ